MDAEAFNTYMGPVIGFGVGLVLAAVLTAIGIASAKRSLIVGKLAKRTWLPLAVTLSVLGAWLGFILTKPADPENWYQDVAHALLIASFAAGGWLVFAGLGLMSDPTILTNVSTGRDARRYWTQAQIFEKVLRATTVLLTVIFILLTFPEARAPMASILASAGLLSVIAGLAAQTTLATMFAGLQLAFTDAIRVGDTVMLPDQDQPGQVEEITLTYVVVRIWDGRRMILPSTQFTNQSFENWTRESANQIASFELMVDWQAPIAEIRAEVERLLEESPTWDGRFWGVQVNDVSTPHILLKVTVSASNWAKAWDLRAYLRENLVDWLDTNAPWAVPSENVTIEQQPTEEVPLATEEVETSDLASPQFLGKAGGGYMDRAALMKADPDAAMSKEVKEVPKVEKGQITPEQVADKSNGSFLFTGTKTKEDLGSIYDGPGKHTFLQRIKRRLHRRKDELSLPLVDKDGSEVRNPDETKELKAQKTQEDQATHEAQKGKA